MAAFGKRVRRVVVERVKTKKWGVTLTWRNRSKSA